MPLTSSNFEPVEETIHGVMVRDPFRWLENRDLKETESWIREQQEHYERYFATTKHLAVIRDRVRDYLDVETVDQPVRAGSRYFFRRRDRGTEQASLYVKESERERLLVDPSREGPFVSCGIFAVSQNADRLAYQRRTGGEDRASIHFLNVETGDPLGSSISCGYGRGIRFSADGRGVFYCQEPLGSTGDHLILYQSLDDSSSQVAFKAPRSRASRLTLMGDDTHLGAVWIHEAEGTTVEDLWISSHEEPTKWHQVFMNRQVPCSPILYRGRIFVVYQDELERQHIAELSLDGDSQNTIVTQETGSPFEVACADRFLCTLIPATSEGGVVRLWSLDGGVTQDLPVDLPGHLNLLPNLGDGSSLFLSSRTMHRPPILLEYDFTSRQLRKWNEPLQAFRSEVHQHEHQCVSADGTVIPITLVGTSLLNREKRRPALMTTYGGFGALTRPQYSVLARILLELGVVLVFPHIRGGGELGRKWHDAARREKRSVAIDDFVAAARWLSSERITSPQQLAILGGSHGGLLVASAMTRQPDLFGAVVCIAPLLDMVRYECFDSAARWHREYGSVEDAEEFHALYNDSPYHQVDENTDYPATLFVTGDKDDRCNPAHVRKMAARLQNRTAQHRPVLVDCDDQRGHTPVMPFLHRVESLTRRIAFLCQELCLDPLLWGSPCGD